jgi:hypothetical protein
MISQVFTGQEKTDRRRKGRRKRGKGGRRG